MVRFVLAAFTAVSMAISLAACQPSAAIDPDDPWAALHPWQHNRQDVQKTDNGVEYIIISRGPADGSYPAPTDQVVVHYDGRLASDGAQFDTSIGGPPARFRLNEVIPGWTDGLQNLKPGDKAMFWIPSRMGYGSRGAGPVIGPNADLMFMVELLDIIPAPTSNAEAWARVTPWPADSSEVIRTASGLEYLVIKSGPVDAPSPSDRDYAFVHFEGRLDEGDVVASTFPDMRARPFPVEDLVPGWNEALKLMRKGDHWMVRIPPHLMYGDTGDGRIPASAMLTYEIVLEDVIIIDPPQ